MSHTVTMTEARRQLNRLVGRLQRDPALVYTLTPRGHPVAELRALPQGVVPGLAAHTLIQLISTLPKPRRRSRTNISTRTKKYLYGRGGAVN